MAGYTPLLVQQLSKIWYTTFDALAEDLQWIPRADGKETAECLNMEVWSDAGWTRLERLIRHSSPQALVRIMTSRGVVDVTADHSLVLENGRPVKPRDVGILTRLLHHPLPEFGSTKYIPPPPEFSKRIPSQMVTAQVHVRKDFLVWYVSTFGPVVVFESQEFLDMARLIALVTSCGYFYQLELDVENDLEKIKVTLSADSIIEEYPNAIMRMGEIDYDGNYVYDCTTANHHFAAGPGTLVVHNTDSVMVKFKVPPEKRHDMQTHFELAERVAAEISKTFPGCVELEFEKCYFPYCLYSKKRYAGLMYTSPDKHDYIDVKGLQLVRRDNAPIVKLVSQGILDAIMYEKSTDKALEAARNAVLRVITGQEPLENFTVSKSLRGKYANPNAQPHVQVARKIKERTGETLGSGTRVPYVFVVDNNIDGLISSRAEDPAYALENSLEIDYLYYLENQLLSPITALLEVLVDNPAKVILESPEICQIVEAMRESRKNLVRDVKRVKTNVKNKQHEITSFFSRVKTNG